MIASGPGRLAAADTAAVADTAAAICIAAVADTAVTAADTAAADMAAVAAAAESCFAHCSFKCTLRMRVC